MREQHGNTVTWLDNEPPDAVVYPQSTADVQEIVRICSSHGLPIVPFGVGSSLEGHVNAPFGGVSIDFRDMNKVIAVHPEEKTFSANHKVIAETVAVGIAGSGVTGRG